MADPAVAQLVLQQYPWVQALLGIPEVSQLILDSVDPNIGFDANTFQAKLYQTNWWRTTPEPSRQAFIQGAIDPATRGLAFNQQFYSLTDWAQRLGIHVLGEERNFIAEWMLQTGQDINSPDVQVTLRNWLMQHPDRVLGAGQIDLTGRRLQGIAAGEYFVSLDPTTANQYAIQMATGALDEQAMRTRMNDFAYAAYPHLRDRLDKGETPAQIINPMRQIIADELELEPEAIDPRSAQWSFMLGMPDANDPSGFRLPTFSEVQEAARRDARWWDTSKGRQADAGMAQTLLAAFGKRAA